MATEITIIVLHTCLASARCTYDASSGLRTGALLHHTLQFLCHHLLKDDGNNFSIQSSSPRSPCSLVSQQLQRIIGLCSYETTEPCAFVLGNREVCSMIDAEAVRQLRLQLLGIQLRLRVVFFLNCQDGTSELFKYALH